MREAVINSYEVTFILDEAATAEQATAKTKEISALIEKMGGKAEKHEAWGKRELAYPIRRNRSGFYVTVWFTLPSNQVSAFERALRFDEAIIRSLVTKAYTTAQPGSLYPVPEEEKPARAASSRRAAASDAVSAEEELRRHTGEGKAKTAEESSEELSEEDRLKKLDEAMGELLKEDSSDEESAN